MKSHIKRYTPANSLRGKSVYTDSAVDAGWPFTFVRWVRMPMHSGGENTDKIGVGAIVYVPWRCGPPFNRKPPRGFSKGHFVLRPYWDLYRTARNGYASRCPINRPPVSRVKMYRDER